MSQEIFTIAEEIFKLSRLHVMQCDNPRCCLKLMLDNLDLEKKDMDVPNPYCKIKQPNFVKLGEYRHS